MNTMTSLGPRAAAYFVKELMDRGKPFYVFEKFGKSKPLPTNSTKVMSFRRYFLAGMATWTMGGTGAQDLFNPYEYWSTDSSNEALENQNLLWDVTTTNNGSNAGRLLGEGVTPQEVDLESEDMTVTIAQYGLWTEITDMIADCHDDPIMLEAGKILGEAAAFLSEKIYYNALKAAGNVYYCGGAAVGEVDEAISLDTQRKVVRGLKRNLGKPITSIVKSTPAYGTEPIAASFICITHTDMEPDIRALPGYVPCEKYGTVSPMEGEIGKVENVRYITSTTVQALGEVGAAIGTTGLEGSSNVIVYPMIYLAADAYAVVPLKGKNAFTPMILPPGVPRGEDPLGQRGSIGIKFCTACKVLHDYWMCRVYSGCTALV